MKIKIISSLFLALLLVIGAFSLSVNTAEARTVRVKSYYKPSTGRYVMPSYRTSPNRSRLDNWSTKGNYNPYTGKSGTRSYYGY